MELGEKEMDDLRVFELVEDRVFVSIEDVDVSSVLEQHIDHFQMAFLTSCP